jgi:flotillin
MTTSAIIFLSVAAILAATITTLMFWVISLRRVVSTNEVHIIQSSHKTVSYGKDQEAGNTYYEWPAWIPIIGIQVIKLPVSVFSLRLRDYEAYDNGRLPFILDLEAFFRIDNSNIAAQRVAHFQELNGQLTSILQGAARTILASKNIEEIMQGRSEFGVAFTAEVNEQLKAWGVTTVKNIELMDIRDSKGSQVIQNIMDKKKSEIDRESRVVVAENRKAAENAEIDAQREVEINRQLAEKQVGIKTAEKEKEVGIALEKSQQEIKDQQKITTEKAMEVTRVEQVKSAEIEKDVNIVRAEETKQTDIVKAEGEKQKTVLIAEGQLEAERRDAESILIKGQATAEAEKLLQLAPVEAQIVLAKEIGENQSYQQYLITIRQVEATQAVGIEQAKALEKADIKVIANNGTVTGGVASLGDLFTSQGGTNVGALLEGITQTPTGKAIFDKLVGDTRQ